MDRLLAPARGSVTLRNGWLLRTYWAALSLLLWGLAGCGDRPPAPNTKAISRAAMRAALEQLVDVEADETPLKEVLDRLAAQANVKIVYDIKSLEDAGHDFVNEPCSVTLRLHGVRLKTALRRLLRPCLCRFDAEDNQITVTAFEPSDFPFQAEVYPVSDIVERDSDRLNERFLAELVSSTVAPQSWEDVGGPGTIQAVPGALIVCQPEELHEQVVDLLTELREFYATLDPTSTERPTSHRGRFPFTRRAAATPAAASIREALPRIVSYDFEKVPLREVFDQIAREQQINIVIDENALEDAGQSSYAIISERIVNVSLEIALRLILRPVDLTYILEDELLLITSRASCDCALLDAIYAVDDLLDAASGFDERELAEVLSACIEPQSWDEVGGPGIIQPIPRGLVVSQTSDAQVQIADFLDRLASVIQPAAEGWSVEEPLSEADQAIQDKLVTVDRSDLAIRPALNDLLKQHDIPVAHWPSPDSAANDVWLLDEVPARVVHRDCTLANILSDELIEREMEWWIEDGRLKIGRRDDWDYPHTTRVYRMAPFYQNAFYSPNDPVIALMKAHIDPQHWDDVGGPCSVMAVPCGMVVDAYPATQQQVVWFLQALRRLEEADAPRMVRCSPCQDADELERMLDQMVTMKADPTGQETLEGLLKRLAAAHGLSDRMLIDLSDILREAIDKSESPLDLPATEAPTGEMPLWAALTELLEPHGLDYWIDESRSKGRIVIGSRETAQLQQCSTRLYRFVQSPEVGRNSLERLRDHLHRSFQRTMTIRWPNCLAVTAVPEVHREIAAELDRVLPHFERGEPLPEAPHE